MSLLIESTPYSSLIYSLGVWTLALVELHDGSFVSCSSDKTAKRWAITRTDNKTLQLLGTFLGHTNWVVCAVEKDNDTILTGSLDYRLKEWNTTSCECLRTVEVASEVYALTKTRNGERIMCGLLDGSIEVRNTDGLGLIFVVNIHAIEVVFCIRELEDGSFVSTSSDKTMKRWNDKGEVLQVFSGHVNSVLTVIQMTSDTIVSSGDRTLKLWKLSTGECLSTIKAHADRIPGLFKLSKDKFVSASTDKTIRVWDVR